MRYLALSLVLIGCPSPKTADAGVSLSTMKAPATVASLINPCTAAQCTAISDYIVTFCP